MTKYCLLFCAEESRQRHFRSVVQNYYSFSCKNEGYSSFEVFYFCILTQLPRIRYGSWAGAKAFTSCAPTEWLQKNWIRRRHRYRRGMLKRNLITGEMCSDDVSSGLFESYGEGLQPVTDIWKPKMTTKVIMMVVITTGRRSKLISSDDLYWPSRRRQPRWS